MRQFSAFLLSAWRLHQMFVFQSFILANLFDFYFATRIHFIEDCSILIQRKLNSLMLNGDSASLKLMQETSIDLWRLSELLNKRFAYTLLISITTKLVLFIVDIYWVYLRVIHNLLNMDFIRTLIETVN